LHCALYTARCTLRTMHCTLHAVHFMLSTAHCTLGTLHGRLCRVHCSLYRSQCVKEHRLLLCNPNLRYRIQKDILSPMNPVHSFLCFT